MGWPLASIPASAGEGLFSRVYTTDTTPAGHYEVEEIIRQREGRAYGSYNATDLDTEVEYGVTDKFQVAGYLNMTRMDAKNAPDDDDPNGVTGFTRNNFAVQSIAGEFIYRFFSPYETDGWGLAAYVEPAYMFHDQHNGLRYGGGTFEGETRLMLQKNFLDDRLILAYNLILEFETIKFAGDPDRNSELDWNNEFGVSYRFASNWFGGLEFRNHNEYGNFDTHEHSVFWVGPVLHYGGERFWATLGWLRQVAGNPGHDEDGNYIGGNLFLRSHELNEVTFKVGVPF
ncbi:DUF6662 family protein [Nitrospirillum sp. BR 11752]|uniref:DUF6662 family protein n=1 Tax=Nitrospirillum sp. BR 11752 TaxID=3104293 RepID=UPI002EB126FD|nr:DUF6662 family protein [Nitrospirillum sp. BR 11752]